jgi:hypothetical protein
MTSQNTVFPLWDMLYIHVNYECSSSESLKVKRQVDFSSNLNKMFDQSLFSEWILV